MAVTVGTVAELAATSPQSITVDGGPNRLVVAYVCQPRTPTNLTNSLTLNGESPSGVLRFDNTTFSNDALLAAYWLDASLPAAGTYNIAWAGSSAANIVGYLNASGVSQAAPEYTNTTDNAVASSSFSVTLSSATSGALLVSIGKVAGGTTMTYTTGTGIETSNQAWAMYTTGGNTLAGTLSANDTWIQVTASFAPTSGSSLDPIVMRWVT